MTHPRNPNSSRDDAPTVTGTTVAGGAVFFDSKGNQETHWTIPYYPDDDPSPRKTRHEHRWRWTAWLCGKAQWFDTVFSGWPLMPGYFGVLVVTNWADLSWRQTALLFASVLYTDFVSHLRARLKGPL